MEINVQTAEVLAFKGEIRASRKNAVTGVGGVIDVKTVLDTDSVSNDGVGETEFDHFPNEADEFHFRRFFPATMMEFFAGPLAWRCKDLKALNAVCIPVASSGGICKLAALVMTCGTKFSPNPLTRPRLGARNHDTLP